MVACIAKCKQEKVSGARDNPAGTEFLRALTKRAAVCFLIHFTFCCRCNCQRDWLTSGSYCGFCSTEVMGHIQSCMKSSGIHDRISEEDTPLKAGCDHSSSNDLYVCGNSSSLKQDDARNPRMPSGGTHTRPIQAGVAENLYCEKKKALLSRGVLRGDDGKNKLSGKGMDSIRDKTDGRLDPSGGEKRPSNKPQGRRPCFSHPFSGLTWNKTRNGPDKQKPHITTVCPSNLYGDAGLRKENRVMMNKLPAGKPATNVRHVKLPPHPSMLDGGYRQKHYQKLGKALLPQCAREDIVNDCVDIESMGARAFGTDAILNSKEQPVELVCLDPTLQIFVCDIGLTPTQCHSIISMAEDCANEAGRYAAYTYAKQTLGCRDYDNLASRCAIPIHVACQSIRYHMIGNVGCGGFSEEGVALTKTSQEACSLVLDEREPHIVKYDTVEKTRQKLDMHTDKSEWTFLIALSDYGIEYEGGGTYFESSRTTYHLMRGQCLMFPGKLKHCGKKITKGKRYLLVGFMVKKDDVEVEEEPLAPDATSSGVRSRIFEPKKSCDKKPDGVPLSCVGSS